MLVIRFIRIGKKNQPFFRIIVTNKKSPPRGGRFLEVLGFFNPLTKEKKLKAERIKRWLGVGAQPSDRVYNLLISEGIVEGKKKPVHKKAKKKPSSASEGAAAGKEEAEKEAPAPEPASPTKAAVPAEKEKAEGAEEEKSKEEQKPEPVE